MWIVFKYISPIKAYIYSQKYNEMTLASMWPFCGHVMLQKRDQTIERERKCQRRRFNISFSNTSYFVCLLFSHIHLPLYWKLQMFGAFFCIHFCSIVDCYVLWLWLLVSHSQLTTRNSHHNNHVFTTTSCSVLSFFFFVSFTIIIIQAAVFMFNSYVLWF